MPVNIIAVDWGKDARKRSAYMSDLHARLITRLPFDGRLSRLLDHAISLQGPVLIGIDAAIGFPAADWRALTRKSETGVKSFTDFLLGDTLLPAFFNPVHTPADWSPQRPFIRPPSGRWSLKAFEAASNGGFYRMVDRRLKAQPIFVTSGIPGSVGSGTRALWQELRELHEGSGFRIWPFHGAINELLRNGRPVIAEIYPKACYGIALSESLPAPLLSISKTRRPARQSAIDRLLASSWTSREKITIDALDEAVDNEDDFDAMISAAALTRLFLERAPLEKADDIESRIEGGVLGAASLSDKTAGLPKSHAGTGQHSPLSALARRCPIPGCDHVFRKGRSGWDAHVASVRRHPDWYPDIRNAARRKELFRIEFPEWFARASRNPGNT